MQWLVVIGLLAALGCGGDDAYTITCTPPDATEYSCTPLPAGSYGCIGGPVWLEHYEGLEHREDPDKIFPAFCHATIPECGCCYSTGRTFVCSGSSSEPNDAGVDGAPLPAHWVELL